MTNNNILDVLTYMFDYLFEVAEKNSSREIDDTALKDYLSSAGFEISRINKALSWLENIANLQDNEAPLFSNTSGGMRIYSKKEQLKLDAKCRGFLLFMENIGQINDAQREVIVDQAMSLDSSVVSLEDLKWIVMMVLGNSNHETSSPQWLESVVFLDDDHSTIQ